MKHPLKKKESKELIKKLVELVYISGYLKNEKPLSLFLLAPPEQSKSHFLLEKTTKFCHHATDLSFAGLIKILRENKNIKQIVIPDFLKITGKKHSTKNNLLTLLNSFLEEGIFEIDLGNHEKIDLKGRNGGIITATTDFSFHQNKKNWVGIGFSSRFILASYKYSKYTQNEIISLINKNTSNLNPKPKLLKFKSSVVESSPDVNELLNNLNEGGSLRKQKNLITLLKCIALRNGRTKTNKSDVKELEELNKIMNTEFEEI